MVRSLAILIEFRILGPLEVLADGEMVPLGGAKQRALLALLLLRPNEAVSVGRIVDELWGERAPPTAAKNVQVYVSHLRRVLGDGVVVTQAPGYALQVADGAIDAQQAERALALAAGKPPAERAAVLNAALGLWRGVPLADLIDVPFAQAEVTRLDELRLQLVKRRTDADLELGRHEAVVGELERLVALHAFDEGLRVQLMLALYRSGRQTDALAVYRDARRALTTELGLEPGEDLRLLEQRILAHDPSLRPPAAPIAARPAGPLVLPRRRTLVLVSAAGLLAAAAVTVAVLARAGDPSPAVAVPSNAIAVVDPGRGAVVAAIPVGRRPEQVVVGAGGVWVANVVDRTLSRIDPESLGVNKTVGLGFEPTDLAADDEHVWVVGGYEHSVWRLDRDGAVRLKLQFDEQLGPLPDEFERGPAGIAVSGQSVWIAHGDEVTELDPISGERRRTIRAGGRWHREVAANEQRVWVGYNDVTRPSTKIPSPGIDLIDTSTGRRLERAKLVSDASEIVFASGRLWVAVRVTGAVWELDPASGLLQRTLAVGNEPEGIAFHDNSLWVTNELDATLRRINPTTGETETVIPIGYALGEVAAAQGRLFVAVRGP